MVYLILFVVVGWIPAQDTEPKGYLKLATWNIRIFSNERTDEEIRMICRVAKNFDFIAIVELRDETVLKRLVTMLQAEFGRSYSYELSPYVGSTDEDRSRELYAFLYDRTFITVVQSGKLYIDSTFLRYPYYATFRAGSFDFTAIVTHVIWGTTVTARRKEINRLAYVYQTIQDGDPNENDVLLLGDFNRQPDDDLAWGPLKAISSMVHLFNVPEKSMIWDTNLYDNILFQSQYTKEYTLDHGIIRFDETDFGNDDEKACAAVSDHRPAWALFNISGPDDD
jgi:endonuclease/exonuclease/phosphatase family metal-dependent hydrolase